MKTLTSSKIFTLILHLLIWTGIFLLPFMDEERRQVNDYFLFRNGFFLLLLASFYYINYYGLIPRLFLPKKTIAYYSGVIILLLLICFLNYFFANLMDYVFDHTSHRPSFWKRFSWPVFPVIFVFGISTAIRLTNEWFRNEKQKKEMENEKLTSELAFLKSQVNPHFLFNILNNICSLARKKSDSTENAIIKLSQIMRYMLSDSKDEMVNLEKEIDYLKNYIELQQLRISGVVDVGFRVNGDPSGKMIAPMLLIPFVENAFKHGVSYIEKSNILIDISVNEDNVRLVVENLKVPQSPGNDEESGIGLKNVLRRLELLYPDKYILKVDESGDKYRVDLKIGV